MDGLWRALQQQNENETASNTSNPAPSANEKGSNPRSRRTAGRQHTSGGREARDREDYAVLQAQGIRRGLETATRQEETGVSAQVDGRVSEQSLCPWGDRNFPHTLLVIVLGTVDSLADRMFLHQLGIE